MERKTKNNKISRTQKIHQNIHLILLVWIVASLPWAMSLNGLGVILLGANWLFSLRFRQKIKILRERFNNYALILLFMLILISYFLSENKNEAGFVIEQNISLFTFPLILGSTYPILKRSDVHKILIAFVLSCIVAMWICLFGASLQLASTPFI